MIKILVTSDRGFIGSKLSSFLEQKGYEVLGLDEDIRDGELIAPYFMNVDFVIHTAGETQNQDNEELCHSTNVLGTKNVIESCIKNKCKLIHLSSTARKTAYGRSKQESQDDVKEATGKGLKAIILRLCPIVTLNDPLMVWGRRYPVEELIKDIEEIIRKHNFDKFELIDYEKSTHIRFPRT